MEDTHAFAKFLRAGRETLDMNPREFADAITAAGGKASTQAVQQWENTSPDQRTTRPNQANRFAIAVVLKRDFGEVEDAYDAARDQTKGSGARKHQTERTSLQARRSGKGNPFAPIEQAIRDAICDELPEGNLYLDKQITPFGVRREFDYLSPKLAAIWLMSDPAKPYFDEDVLAARLWRLLWLSKLDSDTSVSRKYLLILCLIDHDALAVLEVKALTERLTQETRVFGNFITIRYTSSPQSAAELVTETENDSLPQQVAIPASTIQD